MAKAYVFKLGNITVSVSPAGAALQPWGNAKAFEYKVRVRSPEGATYSASAWGSINDYNQKHRNPRGIGAMVVEELMHAHNDPEEFLSMASPSNRASFKRTITSAKKFRFEDLDAAIQQAQEEGLT
jgi:hypothetical protein